MFNDSDEYDFNPASSSKLSALFGNTNLSDDFNNSLTYTAPKQPKAKKEPELNESVKSKPQTSVLIAKIVSLWKLEGKDYKSLGKHGLAVIGSSELGLYEIIAYKEKHNILLRRKINDAFSFYNRKEQFSTFYDNDNQYWLVKFDKQDDQNTFCQTIQNCGAKIVDSIEETPQNDKIETNTIREEADQKPDIIETKENEVEVNSDSSGSQKKANILSRMAKMGQQILPSPLLKNTSTDVSDSELDDTKNERKVPPRKFKRAVHAEKNASPKEEQIPQAIMHQNYQENQIVPSQNNYPVQFPQNVAPPLYYQPMQYDFSNFVMAQNAELKMSLAQISAKLDSALIQSNSNSNSQVKTDDATLKSKIKVLELKARNLQDELGRYEKKYNNLEKNYKELQEKVEDDRGGHKESEIVIENLREEICKLRVGIKESEEQVSIQKNLENELEECRNTIREYEKTIELQTVKLKDMERFYEDNKDNKINIDSLNETIVNLKLKLKDLEEYYQKMEEEKRRRSEDNTKIINTFSDKIKEHMNNMYQSILVNFQDGSTYSFADVHSCVAHNLKGTTFKIIDDLKTVFKDDE